MRKRSGTRSRLSLRGGISNSDIGVCMWSSSSGMLDHGALFKDSLSLGSSFITSRAGSILVGVFTPKVHRILHNIVSAPIPARITSNDRLHCDLLGPE